MKLISGVNIKEFRSIRQTQGILNSFGNFNTFAGLNNSGKSNFLRALNAYFTGYTEPANALNYRNDYNKYDLHKKKHEKTLEISVTFSLPSNFKFRAKLENIKSYLNSDSFTITKKWYRDKNTPDYFFNNEETPVDFEARQKLDQFLSLINFRYIPNRVMPIDIIKNEHQALRDVLIRRLGLRTKTSRKTFSKIQEISSHLIGSLSERLHKMNVGSSKIRLATPKDWTDMIFAFGYRLGDGQTEIEDSMQGSGIQSLLMLETLYLIDKDYFQQFGWRQASIWAIEEPESSLHCSLEAQVASFLREISIVESSRLQIFATTHSEVMIQYADKSFFTEQKNNETNFKGDLNVRDMLLESGKAGVSKYVHPIIHHPLEPIILVDGENDIPFIEKSIALLFPKLDIKVTYLGNWDKGKTGGENDIYSYLKANKNVVAYRDKCAPIIILLDWESRDIVKYQNLARDLGNKLIIYQWPKEKVNPRITRNFHGIERFYPDRLIEFAYAKESEKIGKTKNNKFTVHRDDYGSIKKILSDEILTNGLNEDDLLFAKDFISLVIKGLKS